MKLNFVDEPPRRKAKSDANANFPRLVVIAILVVVGVAVVVAWWTGWR
jgi:hypothetical protein